LKKLLKLDKKILLLLSKNNEKKFEVYVSPTINFLNALAGSKTGPKKVGQLSNIFSSFLSKTNKDEINIESWKKYYLNLENVLIDFPKEMGLSGKQAIDKSVDEIYILLEKFRISTLDKITKKVITKWVDDLIFQKTFEGMRLEEPIASFVSKQILIHRKMKFNIEKIRKSIKEEESKGIDYIYEIDENKMLYFQIKTGNIEQGNNISNRQQGIPKIKSDIYHCVYEKNKNNISLKVFFNNKLLYNWS